MSQEPTITTAVAGMKDISSYEELRQSNIKRNAEFLETIGIHAESVDTHSILKKKKRSPAVVQTAVQVPAPAATVFPTRRSTRVAVQDAVNYNEVSKRPAFAFLLKSDSKFIVTCWTIT